jgi:hypothetical protein
MSQNIFIEHYRTQNLPRLYYVQTLVFYYVPYFGPWFIEESELWETEYNLSLNSSPKAQTLRMQGLNRNGWES